MAVTIEWSEEEAGLAITSNDHGDVANGQATDSDDGKVLYFSHDGVNEVTDVGLYITSYIGDYVGDASAYQDYLEVIAWGDATDPEDQGGFQINMNATNEFPEGSWLTCSTGYGDSENDPIPLVAEAVGDGTGTAGEVPASATNNRIKIRFNVPNSEDTLGTRYVSLRTKYTATS